jgi:iron(III) transport system substrate-binding protein
MLVGPGGLMSYSKWQKPEERAVLRVKFGIIALVVSCVLAAVAAVSQGSAAPAGKTSDTATAARDNSLVIYGNPPPAQIKPVLDAFQRANPGIKVNYTDQDDNVSFSKYRAESAQHARTADVIIASSPMNWYQNRGIAANWTPRDVGAFPGFIIQAPGVFVLSPDPAVSLYNKVKLPANRVPHSFSELESNLKKYPGLFKKKIATFTVDNQFGYSAFWGLAKKHGWFGLNLLGPATKPQADGTAVAKQVLSGGSNFAFFESGLIRGAVTGQTAKLVGWTYMKDFTPLIPRGIAVTKGARNARAGKTFVDFLFSAAGQRALCGAGFTAYRRGVSCGNSLANIQRSAKTYLVPISGEVAQAHRGFVARWHRVFR